MRGEVVSSGTPSRGEVVGVVLVVVDCEVDMVFQSALRRVG